MELRLVCGDDEGWETVEVEEVSDCRFLLKETPFLCEQEGVHLGAVIDTQVNPEGVHRLVRIVVPSPYQSHQFLLAEVPNEETRMKVGKFARSHGVVLESVFGGILIVSLPEQAPAKVLNQIMRMLGYYE